MVVVKQLGICREQVKGNLSEAKAVVIIKKEYAWGHLKAYVPLTCCSAFIRMFHLLGSSLGGFHSSHTFLQLKNTESAASSYISDSEVSNITLLMCHCKSCLTWSLLTTREDGKCNLTGWPCDMLLSKVLLLKRKWRMNMVGFLAVSPTEIS